VLGLPVSLILSLGQPLFLLFPALYVGAVFSISLLSRRKSRGITEKQRLLMAAACILMHVSWGVGFLAYALSRLAFRKKRAIKRESDD
jgi:hypothetical protein